MLGLGGPVGAVELKEEGCVGEREGGLEHQHLEIPRRLGQPTDDLFMRKAPRLSTVEQLRQRRAIFGNTGRVAFGEVRQLGIEEKDRPHVSR